MNRGYILLEGGSEFGGKMAEPDLRAIHLAGGLDAAIAIIPAAAAPDHNHQRAGENGVRWFTQLGTRQISLLPLIDSDSADQPAIAEALRAARLIYMLGGFPGHLGKSLAGSLSWEAILDAYRSGAVVGGSSAGAMVLCQHYYDPYAKSLSPGLNLLPGACVLPHHNTFGKGWAAHLSAALPDSTLIGIDEQTGMIDDGPDGMWTVYGRGAVSLYRHEAGVTFHPGESFSL